MKSQSPSLFAKFAKSASRTAGHPITFIVAAASIVIWAATGPVFGYSDTWQLIINTSTTIVTFLMVFLIQNSQNRESEAVQIKLDELIRALSEADNDVLDIEELSDDQIADLHKRYIALAERARAHLDKNEPAEKSDAGAGKQSSSGAPVSRTP